MTIKVPNYAVNFKCIGGACSDSCCIGWDVDVDKATYERYLKVQDPQFKKAFKRAVTRNPNATDTNVDYAQIQLTAEKRCHFLNKENWCILQKHLGADYLSNVCATYPRIYNRVNGALTMSLNPSCPEAARLLMAEAQPMQMVNIQTQEPSAIITFDVNTQEKQFKNSPVKHLERTQNEIEEILIQKTLSFEQRLIGIGHCIERLDKKPSVGNAFTDLNTIAEYVLAVLTEGSAMDTLSFRDWNTQLKHRAKGTLSAQHEDWLTRYYHNMLYKNLFPFAEGENVWDAYCLWIARYAVLKNHLTTIDETQITPYIQSFTKAFEHHRALPYDFIAWLKQKKLYSPATLIVAKQ